MLTLFLIIASVFAEGETQKYIRKIGHTFVEIVNDGCYEETVDGQTKYYKYKIETVETATTIKKCQHTDATCETKSQDAEYSEAEGIDTVTKLPIIATVYEAEGENCATQKEIEYYYHGQCVKVTDTQSEKYKVDVDSKKLVLDTFPTADCQAAATTKRAEGESNDIECNACLDGKEIIRCEGVPAEEPEESSSEPEIEESSSEPEIEESSSEPEIEESSSEPEIEESSSEPEKKTEESSSEPEKKTEESSSEPDDKPKPEQSSKPGDDDDEDDDESSGKPNEKKYYISPAKADNVQIYTVYKMNTCYASEENTYVQYKSNNTKKFEICTYTDKDCKEGEACEVEKVVGGEWVEDLPDHIVVHKLGGVVDDKDCEYLNEAAFTIYTDKCVELPKLGETQLYSKFVISDNRFGSQSYTDNECKEKYEPEEPSNVPEEPSSVPEPKNECDVCYYSKEEVSFMFECGAFQTFIAVALAFVFFLF